ncbi:N-acetylglucosamine kinase [Actinoplanes sp. TBRC 11911]|nr:N-acetylglucosamine kinase [Actinoplanes sp. TBRC 11911]
MVGVDAGATTTRCVVATVDGTIVGRGAAGGANHNSSGGDIAERLKAAMSQALSDIDRRAVAGGILGAAGSSGAGRAIFGTASAVAWRDLDLSGDAVPVTDLEVAFAAGTAGTDGVLLLSGTGALAARFAAGELARRCDGYGWLLGDEGSAVWIGVRALRAVLAALDGRGAPTVLVDAAKELFAIGPGSAEETAQALLTAAFACPPAALGSFAPRVDVAAEQGDPVARRITTAAAAKLLHTLDTVEPDPGQPVVLAGSVLLSPGPVARAVHAGLTRRDIGTVRTARDGAAGAAALALARLTGAAVRPDVHARLTGHERPRG